ncbi:dicarboxylate/amino acid:cation symporter [Panacagrimonas sp.]|uniref:dicarboxylate/amino acid:cation symporter n=1 Tax=Panacagrimonas sp. TaxID=2480088 RepID=UPI003B52806F
MNSAPAQDQPAATGEKRKARWRALHWQIAIALLAAAAFGALLGPQPAFVAACEFVGTLFLNALKMLIVPLILASMISAMLGLGDQGVLGKLGLRTATFFVLTTAVSVLTGLLLVNLVAPGLVDGEAAGAQLGLSADTDDVMGRIEDRGSGDLLAVILRMVPPNLIAAAAQGEMLALIFFGILFGYFASRLPAARAEQQREFWGGLYEIMIAITGWVMRFAPLGVFALVAKTVATTGWSAVGPLMKFFLVVLIGLLIQLLVWLPLILRFVAGVSPLRHLRVTVPALLTAFSTSSSAATLPVSFDCLRRGAGVSPQVSGFVLPLGCTVNMNGTALYECVAAMFIAQAYGLEMSFVTQVLVVALAIVTSVGVAGIPSASLVAIAVILGTIGLPLEGVGLILAVDRVLDMARTAINVYGDTVCAVVVARFEGEDGVLGEPAIARFNRPEAG